MSAENRAMHLPVHVVSIAVFILARTVCWSHEEVNPLSHLRHEMVSISLGRFDRLTVMYDTQGPRVLLCAEESVKLVADPSVLNQSGEWVRVSWSGVLLPQKLDWVGVWLLPNDSFSINAKQQAPVKYQVHCSSYNSHG